MSFKGKVEAVQRETQSPELARLFAVYDAFVEGRLECIPEYFDAHGFYRTSGVFPGMRERYLGHEEIREFWHAATEPWESLQIETGRTMARGEDVVAQIWLTGRGRHSRVEVRGSRPATWCASGSSRSSNSWRSPPGISPWNTSRGPVEHLEGRAGRGGSRPRQ